MVFPTDEESPFSGVGSFREQMIDYIKKNFADLLGDDIHLLDHPDGLDMIQAKYPIGCTAREAAKAAPRPATPPVPVFVEQVQEAREVEEPVLV